MKIPNRVIVIDQDGGYILAERQLNWNKDQTPIYVYKEYYHDLESAMNELTDSYIDGGD